MQRLAHFFLTACAFSVTTLAVSAGDLRLEARLVWGANDEKETVKYEPVDMDLSGKLHRMFKWKNYYEITNRTAVLPLNQSADLKMSDSCTIHVKSLGVSRLEVSCIGQGKCVYTRTYSLEDSQWFIMAGPSAGDTAWIVGLRPVDAKSADKKAVSKN